MSTVVVMCNYISCLMFPATVLTINITLGGKCLSLDSVMHLFNIFPFPILPALPGHVTTTVLKGRKVAKTPAILFMSTVLRKRLE